MPFNGDFTEYNFQERKRVFTTIMSNQTVGKFGDLSGGHCRFAGACFIASSIIFHNAYYGFLYGLFIYAVLHLFFSETVSVSGLVRSIFYDHLSEVEIDYDYNRVSVMKSMLTSLELDEPCAMDMKSFFEHICICKAQRGLTLSYGRGYPHRYGTIFIVILPILVFFGIQPLLSVSTPQAFFSGLAVGAIILIFWVFIEGERSDVSYTGDSSSLPCIETRLKVLYAKYGTLSDIRQSDREHFHVDCTFTRHPLRYLICPSIFAPPTKDGVNHNEVRYLSERGQNDLRISELQNQSWKIMESRNKRSHD